MIVVVDQMRADYLDRFAPEFQYGFKTLMEKSRRYTKARLNYVPTETAPGHATIATGKPPGIHGIIGNDWYDRDAGKIILAVSQPSSEDPGPARLLVDTIGDALKKKDKESKVVAVSFKDRAAIFLGGKHPDACVWFDFARRRFVTSKAYPHGPDWLDDYAKAHPIVKLPPASADWDRRVLALAEEMIRRYDLGKDDHPDLLAISFSATDFIGHARGPNSKEMHQQMLDLDKIIGTLLQDLATADAGYDLVLTADHGVTPIPETRKDFPGAKRLLVNVLKSSLEKLSQEEFPTPGRPWLIAASLPNVYLNRALANEKKLDWSTVLARLALRWRQNPDVAMVYLNNPLIQQDAMSPIYDRSDCPGRSGDLYVRVKEGVLAADHFLGTTHGSPYDDDARVPILFYGRDFSAETIDKPVDNEFIAPTLAKLIGVDF